VYSKVGNKPLWRRGGGGKEGGVELFSISNSVFHKIIYIYNHRL
jgi:hypothetical protein